MINLDIEVFFSSHEIIDNYYSLYVNFYGRMDRHKVKL